MGDGPDNMMIIGMSVICFRHWGQPLIRAKVMLVYHNTHDTCHDTGHDTHDKVIVKKIYKRIILPSYIQSS